LLHSAGLCAGPSWATNMASPLDKRNALNGREARGSRPAAPWRAAHAGAELPVGRTLMADTRRFRVS